MQLLTAAHSGSSTTNTPAGAQPALLFSPGLPPVSLSPRAATQRGCHPPSARARASTPSARLLQGGHCLPCRKHRPMQPSAASEGRFKAACLNLGRSSISSTVMRPSTLISSVTQSSYACLSTSSSFAGCGAQLPNPAGNYLLRQAPVVALTYFDTDEGKELPGICAR